MVRTRQSRSKTKVRNRTRKLNRSRTRQRRKSRRRTKQRNRSGTNKRQIRNNLKGGNDRFGRFKRYTKNKYSHMRGRFFSKYKDAWSINKRQDDSKEIIDGGKIPIILEKRNHGITGVKVVQSFPETTTYTDFIINIKRQLNLREDSSFTLFNNDKSFDKIINELQEGIDVPMFELHDRYQDEGDQFLYINYK